MTVKRWLLPVAGFAACWVPAASAQRVQLDAPACAIEKATYRLQGAPEFTAGFGRRKHAMGASDLMFWVRTPKRLYWFEFVSPNGVGGTWIVPSVSPEIHDAEDAREEGRPQSQAIQDLEASNAASREPDPLQNITFDAFDRELVKFGSPPSSNNDAPARIFMRGLGQALWYSWIWAAAGDQKAEQDSIPTAMWEPRDCSGKPG